MYIDITLSRNKNYRDIDIQLNTIHAMEIVEALNLDMNWNIDLLFRTKFTVSDEIGKEIKKVANENKLTFIYSL